MDAAQRQAWRQADKVLDELLDLPAAARAARLAALDLPGAVRARAERLLAAHEAGDGVLDHPEAVAVPATPDALSGRRLGRWVLHEEIGRGGMAVVYRAVSLDGPAGQDAALKVLTLGALAGSGRELFLREQAVLLRLRHPYIAPLYDAGIAPDGTPWLAMARVEGERIDDWCDAHGQDAAARVRMLLQVCEAVASAHRSLVIHRDIKPSNVLVDGDGRVRLLDFGIARLTDAGDERTSTVLRALTPEYAAPEQFTGAAPATGMDVYGVGALLYRLLAGVAPRAPGRLEPATPALAPSRALRAGAVPGGEQHRQRAHAIRGDLDAITMKALAASPEARYAGVDALADDLKRWLDGLPVRARIGNRRYRAGKFVARHRAGLAAAAALAVVVLAGVGATVWQAEVARQQGARAQAAAEMSEAQLGYLRSVLDVLAPATESTRDLDRHKVLAEAASRALRELSGRPALLASVQLSLGDVARRTGDYRQAYDLFDSAVRWRRREYGGDSLEYATALLELGRVTDKVDPPDPVLAEARLHRAVALLRSRHADAPLLVEALIEHGNQLAALDRYADARPVLEEAAQLCEGKQLRSQEICDRVWKAQGGLERRMGNNLQAAAAYGKLLALRRVRFGPAHAHTAYAQARLGHALVRLGRSGQGLELLEQAHTLQQRTNATPDLDSLQTLCDLAEAYLAFNRIDEALALYHRYLAQVRALFGERSAEYAYGLSQVGGMHHRNGRYADAAAAYADSHAIFADLLGAHTAMAAYTMGRRADALNHLGRHAQALPLAEQALAIHREVFGDRSPRTGERWSHLGSILLALGRHDEALVMFARAQTILRRPPTTGMERQRAFTARSQASIALLAQGHATEALREARGALLEAEAEGDRGTAAYGTALANLVTVTCRADAPAQCAVLRLRAGTEARAPDLARSSRLKLERALASSPAPRAEDEVQARLVRAGSGGR